MAAGSIPSGQARSRRLLILFIVIMLGFPFLIVGSSAMLSSVFPGWAARVGLGPTAPLIERLVADARYDTAPLRQFQRPRPDGVVTTAIRYPVPSEDEALGKLTRACQTHRLKIASPDARRADPTLLCVGQDSGAEVRVHAAVACAPACVLTLETRTLAMPTAGQRPGAIPSPTAGRSRPEA